MKSYQNEKLGETKQKFLSEFLKILLSKQLTAKTTIFEFLIKQL